MQEWLGRHNPNDYLRSSSLTVPPASDARHRALQEQYRALLLRLFEGYRLGVPAGAMEINAARNSMLGLGGIQGAAEAVAAAGFLVTFDVIAGDPRFAPVANP